VGLSFYGCFSFCCFSYQYHTTLPPSIFYRPDALPAAQPTVSKHWRQLAHGGGMVGGGHCLVRMEWRPAWWSVCLSLLIFPCTIKSRSSLLAPGSLGWSRKKAAKRLWRLWYHTILAVDFLKVDSRSCWEDVNCRHCADDLVLYIVLTMSLLLELSSVVRCTASVSAWFVWYALLLNLDRTFAVILTFDARANCSDGIDSSQAAVKFQFSLNLWVSLSMLHWVT